MRSDYLFDNFMSFSDLEYWYKRNKFKNQLIVLKSVEHTYSPDLVLSDLLLFRTIKNALCGERFVNNKEVKEAVQNWFRDQPREFYVNEIRKLQEAKVKFKNVENCPNFIRIR